MGHLSSAGTLLQDRSCMHVERYRATVLLFTEFIGLNRLEVEYQFFSARMREWFASVGSLLKCA
ncbi:hypothetical protein E3A20_00580 [Planctomyces bekefii]|uniref:Uncharacterized protein n=1 Tax=Planctomyces bekefii TaxID=1653850 RepID=A0A5C6MC65_9PLAN|nr:hypothetical protein E3A20_00580 [Planctomyces bekefii]HAV32254.1 hypothetical protein [Planctomycetaceae bacterium]